MPGVGPCPRRSECRVAEVGKTHRGWRDIAHALVFGRAGGAMNDALPKRAEKMP
jgi:hypothetical protein